MLITHHSEVLPVHEEQALITIVVPSVLLPWGFSLRSCHSRLLRCTHIGHLSQAEEPRHHCNPMWLGEQHLTLATCQPSGQGRRPGPSATRSWHTATTISWLPCHPREHPECFPSFPCLSFIGVATRAPLHIRGIHLHGKGLGHSPLCPSRRLPQASLHLPLWARELWGTHTPVLPLHPPSQGSTAQETCTVFLPALSQGSTAPGRRQACQGSAAVGDQLPFS